MASGLNLKDEIFLSMEHILKMMFKGKIMKYFSEFKIIKILKLMYFKKLPEFCLQKTSFPLTVMKSQNSNFKKAGKMVVEKKCDTLISAQRQVGRKTQRLQFRRPFK